jgi:hypothetical protein
MKLAATRKKPYSIKYMGGDVNRPSVMVASMAEAPSQQAIANP